MAHEGADIIDVGGESTRPGAAPVPWEDELARVLPVIEGLRRELRGAEPPLIAVDTRKAAVAERAIAAGADIVNDVSALTADPAMAGACRGSGAGVVLMHMRGEPATMQADPRYADVVGEVSAYLQGRVAELSAQGLDPETLAVDPGIGFGKTLAHNVELLGQLEAVVSGGRPVVVGLSRKSFLGRLTGRETHERLAASLAGLVFAALHGAHVLRVHDVKESVDAVKVLAALRREQGA
jgi:dihydropteroate synthase